MTETFNALTVISDKINEEDRAVHLLASLPDSYCLLVTALEACAEVPKMETVTENGSYMRNVNSRMVSPCIEMMVKR